MNEARQMQYLPYLDPFIVETHADLILAILNRQLQK
jgi:hypothetical protein